MTHKFQIGDIIKHKKSFLETTGFEMLAPHSGTIVGLKGQYALVFWSDSKEGKVLLTNIELMEKKNAIVSLGIEDKE